jgi:hypothetical protein
MFSAPLIVALSALGELLNSFQRSIHPIPPPLTCTRLLAWLLASSLAACCHEVSAFHAPLSMKASTAALSRREVLKYGAISIAATGIASIASPYPAMAEDGPYTLPDLPYDYAALEPHIDTATMK